eukprot:TRINITY_DN9157_c0_g1_i1.p1 TRINITY_DN9157_c0_g1~~TRINITY_DN9157_c0_g1_i1.p1  ORF type:complete len:249 (+),score=59.53 TRINITY_DN9157_c0_g1_i1:121-867(+)
MADDENFASLGLGNVAGNGDALVPTLVPPSGKVYEFKVKEQSQFWDTNKYEWELDLDKVNETEVNKKIAELEGSWYTNRSCETFGHKSVDVKDLSNMLSFVVKRTRSVFNPFGMRYSYRIVPPGPQDDEDSLFTLNKDVFGAGVLGAKAEWRIWRGRERDQNLAYYCVGSYFGFDWKFFKTVEAYEKDEEPVAEISQKLNIGAFINADIFGDKFKLKVRSGEDSALLLAAVTIFDMTKDQEEDSAQRD